MSRLNNSDWDAAWRNRLSQRCPNFMRDVNCPPPPPTPEQVRERNKEWEADKARVAAREEARRTENFVSEVGERYRDATLENYQTPTKSQGAALAAIRAHSEGSNAFAENIVLYGPVGTGKDHLFIALGKLAVKAGKSIRWVFGIDLFRAMRAAIDSGMSEQDTIANLVRPDILILSDPAPPDDAVTTYQRSTLLSVVDQRYRFCRPTWVTINAVGRDDVEDRLGGQAVDRIWTDASQIFVNGPSYRKTNQ